MRSSVTGHGAMHLAADADADAAREAADIADTAARQGESAQRGSGRGMRRNTLDFLP